MKKILFLFISLLLIGCQGKPTYQTFEFTSSDSDLQDAYNWAKAMALSYVGDSNDPVGPWYEASLPQRQAFCMRDVSHQSIGGEILDLSKENFNMFSRFVENISESKDWCTYWEIDKDNQPAAVDYRNDKEFWYNLNANFDVLDACYRTYLWTGDTRYIQNEKFLYFYEKSMTDYMERWQLLPHQIMDRPRFMNSPEPFNIKDSFHKCRGLPSYVENFEGLTISADLLASIYRACLSYAEILRLNGDTTGSRKYLEMAEAYQKLFENEWWDHTEGLYHTFMTADKAFHKGEGETFIVWFEISRTPERIRQSFSHLLSNSWNVENLSYFPKLLYFYGYNEEAYKKILQLPTIERNEYPEVSYGVVEGLVGGLAGIIPDAAQKKIRTLSGLTNEKTWVHLSHLSIFGESVSIRHEGREKSSLENHTSSPLTWKAVFPGKQQTLYCNGKEETCQQEKDVLGNPFSYIEKTIQPGKKLTVTVKH